MNSLQNMMNSSTMSLNDDMVDDSPSVTSGVWQPYSEAQPEI